MNKRENELGERKSKNEWKVRKKAETGRQTNRKWNEREG
jgi:hypothetical protein